MSLFKKRGPTPVEIARENDIKQNITKELSAAVRRLQQEQQQNDSEPILSTDSANAICNILEAVFLHGCKPSVSKKIANYMGINHGYDNGAQLINFWAFCERFTHSDVVLQLKRLAQVNTEIGLCRAWIRLAMNDGLIESYVNAMMADEKSLEYFYFRTAYFRDHEQPEILKSYLKGLMSYEFQLTYNSSILNLWPNVPLVLAGIIDAENTPLPVIHPTKVSKEREDSMKVDNTRDSTEVTQDSVITNKSHRHRGQRKSENKTKSIKSLENGKLSPLSQRAHMSTYSKELTREDVEEIRGMKSQSKTRSECSSSSRVSCPDPVTYNQNPASYVTNRQNDSDVMFGLNYEETTDENKENNEFKIDSVSEVTSHIDCDIVDHLKSAIDSPKSSSKDPSSYGELSYSSFSGGMIESKDYEDINNAENGMPECNMKSVDDICDDTVPDDTNVIDSVSGHITDKGDDLNIDGVGQTDERTEKIAVIKERKVLSEVADIPNTQSSSDKTVGCQNQFVKDNLDFVNKQILEDILNHEFSDHSSSDTQERKDLGNSDSSHEIMASSSADSLSHQSKRKTKSKRKEKFKPEFNSSKDVVQPELSPAVADAIETTMMGQTTRKMFTYPDGESRGSYSSSPARPRSGALSVCLESDNEEGVGISSPASIGNSLGARSGWSSSFDMDAESRGPANDFTVLGRRPKSESFGALLRNYTPSSTVASPTMEDVLQEYQEFGEYSPSSPVTQHPTSPHQEEDFEILTPISDEKPDKQQICLLGEISTEKGLDAQNYQCGSCKRPIGFIYGKPRICTFDGKYYCFECHENEEYYIPAMIIHNWDFRKHIVSKKSLAFLQEIEDHSVIDIYAVNPKLYEHIKEINEIQVLRRQLCHLKTYLFTCKQSVADEFRKSVWPKDYLYESVHMYTLADLLQVPSGQLSQSLKKTIKFASRHVYECPLCSGKGFICELCHNPKVIYPFQTNETVRCQKCKSVFHKSCKSESKSCPKCARWSKRKSQVGEDLPTPDIHDYAFIPLTSKS